MHETAFFTHYIKRFSLIIYLLFIIVSCNKTHSHGTIISGKITPSNTKTVYLNIVDNFDYLNDQYTIDSTFVSQTGDFTFSTQDLDAKLVTITTEKFIPFTYQIYRSAPENFTAGNCAMFFVSIPTLYISDEKNIYINWSKTAGADLINSPDNSGNRQIKLRDFYLNYRVSEANNLNYQIKQDFEKLWQEMLLQKEIDLKSNNLTNNASENSFDNYLYTEIYLGHLNEFLNWFERFYPEDIKAFIRNPKEKNFYSNIFQEYNKHQWNSKSLEYFKFTERYVNFHMNLNISSFNNYYKPSEKKRNIAAKVLNAKNKERYLDLIDKQIKSVSY